MAYRVSVKEIRKTSNACDACKRRKGKCSGTTPCTHCKDCGIECSYSQSNRKRGPVKKPKTKDKEGEIEFGQLAINTMRRDNSSPSSFENSLSNEFEKCSLVDLYLDHMAQGTQSTSRQKLLNPQTLAQKMRTSAVLAFVCRGIGQLSRADQFVAEARVLAGQLLEDKSSFDAAEAFIALSGYFPLHDHRNMTYLGIAHNISKSLQQKTVDGQRLYNFSLIGSTVTDNTMDAATKRRLLKLHGPTLLAAIKEPNPMDILLTAMTKFYCNLNPCLVDALNIEKVVTLKDVQLTKEEADVIMADVMMMEYLVVQQSQGKTLKFLIKVAKILTMWLSGNIDRATKEADDIIEWDSFDAIQYLSAATLLIEIPQAFWLISLFYARLGQLEKAEKVYTMFCTVSNLYGATDLMNTLPTPTVMIASNSIENERHQVLSDSALPVVPSGANVQSYATLDTHATIINIPFLNCPTSSPSPISISNPDSPSSPQSPTSPTYPSTTMYNNQDMFVMTEPKSLSMDPVITLDTVGYDSVNHLLSLPTPVPLGGKEDEYSFLEELLL